MKFNKLKIIYLLLVGSSFLELSTFAIAEDLKISNDSKWDLSFNINDTCSEEFGIINSASIKVISEASLKKACSYNANSCKAKVYNKASCMGKQVATVVFDTSYGVQALYSTGIATIGNGFNLFFEGPWPGK